MSGKRGSNPRPPAWKASALSTELFPQVGISASPQHKLASAFSSRSIPQTSLKEVGGDGFEPPKSKDNRFTVCPIWPLWKPPLMFCLVSARASCRIRTNDPEITNHVLWPTELKRRVGSCLYRAATTKYPCYVPILGDSEGAGRTGLPVFFKSGCKGTKKIRV